MKFQDRIDAGRKLGAALSRLRSRKDLLVLALPRGGVPVAAEVARVLNAPLDLCFAHKIGAPNNPELAVGSVAESGPPYVEEQTIAALRVPYSYIREEGAFQQEDLARRAAYFRQGRAAPVIRDKWVILIDDGVATGATAHAALRTLRGRGAARVIFATPVAPADTVQRLAVDADELAILHAPAMFFAVADFYDRFLQVSDGEVLSLLSATVPA